MPGPLTLEIRVRCWRLGRLAFGWCAPTVGGRRWPGIRFFAFWISLLALVACGPVAQAPEEHPAETVGRQAVEALLRNALDKACIASMPHPEAHPVAYLAWTVVCQTREGR
jgi:hypothetical protein